MLAHGSGDPFLNKNSYVGIRVVEGRSKSIRCLLDWLKVNESLKTPDYRLLVNSARKLRCSLTYSPLPIPSLAAIRYAKKTTTYVTI